MAENEIKEEEEFVPMGRMGIDIHGELIEVFPYDKHTRFDKGYAYIKDDHVYIFRGKLKKKPKKPTEPGSVYTTEGKELVWIPAGDDSDEYSTSRIFPLTPDGILQEVTKRENLKSVNPILLDRSGDCFAPRLLEQDDALKVIIKKCLEALQVNVKPIEGNKDKSSSEMINNLKSNLINPDTRMSILYFAKWCWLLGIEAKLSAKCTNSDGEVFETEIPIRYNYNIR